MCSITIYHPKCTLIGKKSVNSSSFKVPAWCCRLLVYSLPPPNLENWRDPAFSFAQFVTLPKKYRNHESETLVIGRLSSSDGFIVSSGPKSWSHWPHMFTPLDRQETRRQSKTNHLSWRWHGCVFFSKTQPIKRSSG